MHNYIKILYIAMYNFSLNLYIPMYKFAQKKEIERNGYVIGGARMEGIIALLPLCIPGGP